MTKVTVPFFISHQGCPHTCVFCDQRVISGSGGSLPDSSEIIAKIQNWLHSAAGRPVEVAFFGGTFTALSRNLQQELLLPVQSFIAKGEVTGIRISTRPDCITDENVQWLAGMGVKIIELGIQSMDNDVLMESGRGHDSAASETAMRSVLDQGLSLGAQLMPGLPGDSTEKALDSLDRVMAAGAGFVRIYPVVVLKGTVLAERYFSGKYRPLTVEQGVDISKRLLQRAMQSGIGVIRIGLQADHGLNSDNIISGCWHPALGQLVRSELFYDLALKLTDGMNSKIPIEISCHPSRISDVTGHKSMNLKRFKKQGFDEVNIVKNSELSMDEIMVSYLNQKINGDIVTGLKY